MAASIGAIGSVARGDLQYFAGDGSSLGAQAYGPSAAGPFTSAYDDTNTLVFATPNGQASGGSITLGNIIATENLTITAPDSHLMSTTGVIDINVSKNKTLDFGGQMFLSSTTMGFTKDGDGVLALMGTTYKGGFTLDAGTVVARADTALGSSSSPNNEKLTINGGVLAATSTRNFSAKFAGGIYMSGDFTLGGSTGLASPSASMTFSNDVNLGSGNRTITLGDGTTGTYSFGGAFNSSGGGLTIAGPQVTPNPSLPTGPIFVFGSTSNSYTGATNLAGGITQFNSSSSFAKTSAINFTGMAALQWGAKQTDDLSAKIGAGSGIGAGAVATFSMPTIVTFANALTGAGGIATDGSGKLILAANNLYGGNTSIGSNSTLQVGNGGTTGTLGTGTGPITFTASGGHLSFNRSDAITVPNRITGAGSVQQIGTGKLTLSGSSDYSGGTTVTSGTLLANGASATGSGNVLVSSGATLGGTGGTIGGSVSVASGGTITGGSGPTANDTVGTLTINGFLDTSANPIYAVKLDGSKVTADSAHGIAVPGSSDELIVSSLNVPSGSFTQMTFSPVLLSPGSLTSGTTYSFLIAHATTTGAFLPLNLPSTAMDGDSTYAVRKTNNNSDLVLDYTYTAATPEPTALALAGVGIAPLLLSRRRRIAIGS